MLIAVAPVLGFTIPAHADITYGTSDGLRGTFTDTNAGGGHNLQLNGEFAGIAVGNTLVEEFWCAAWATPDALATTLQSCTLSGVGAISLTTYPGGLAVGAGVATFSLLNLPPGGLQLCGSGLALFAESTLGSSPLSASACTPAPTALPQIPDPTTIESYVQAVEQDLITLISRVENYCTILLDSCPLASP